MPFHHSAELVKPVVKDLGRIIVLFWQNRPIITALTALLVAQVLKMIYFYISKRKFNLSYLFAASGMPSSHTAMVASLATAMGLHKGWDSPSFALAFIFAMIVMYDAAGVRRAAGHQARILNQIIADIFSKKKFSSEKLSELIGHTRMEVFAGAIVGVIIAFMMY